MARSTGRFRSAALRAVLSLGMSSAVRAGATALGRDPGGMVGSAAARSPSTPALPSTSAGAAPPGAAVTGENRIDSVALDEALAEAGVEVPDGASVYAALVVKTPKGLDYERFEAGGGAVADNLWPASSIKVLAAEGALEYLADLGFTGAATVTMGDDTFTVADLYEAAITDSSNEAYDTLVQIAGVDWLNTHFLTAENGFPDTVIQRSYTGFGVRSSPEMTISENGRQVTVPARESTGTYDCPDDGNCSNLVAMTDSVARVVLHGELDPADRLNIAPADITGLQDALRDAEGFIEPAVDRVLGPDVEVYNKPGYVPGDSCVDVAVLDDPATSQQYLLGVATPDDGPTCPAVVHLATATLDFLESAG